MALIEYEVDGRVALLTFNRPEKLNAFSDDTVREFRARLHQFDMDEERWVAIVQGAGRAYSSGADVQQRQVRSTEELRRIGGHEGHGARAHGLFFECVHWKPVISAVHGYALGMALGIALESDILVTDCDTQFQVTETRRGMSGARYWAMLAMRAGSTFANDVTITGRYFSGQEAFEKGVANYVTQNNSHVERAREIAGQILKCPPLAVREGVRTSRYYMEQQQASAGLLQQIGHKLDHTEDFKESALAFTEKRAPRPFLGR